MSHKANPRAQTNAQKIKAYFEANPTAHVPASSLAKALKMGPTICADAAGKLAVMGELHREKKPSGDSTKEVWIYSLPAPDTVTQRREAKAFKPLKPATAFRRETTIEAAPSIIGPQAEVHASAQPQPEVGEYVYEIAETARIVPDGPQGSAALPAPPAYDPRQVSFNAGDRAVAQAVRNDKLIDAIWEALGLDYDQPTEALVDHVKALKERAEKAEADLESMASAARKFCTWVADEFPVSHFPLNLHECQQTIKQNLERSDEHMVELTQKANEAQARADDLDRALSETITDRDVFHGKADQLAQAIGEYFGRDVGEHSSAHCPWDEALEIIESLDPADDLGSKALILEQYQAILNEHHIESPAQLRPYLALIKTQGEHIAAAIKAKAPEAYAVAAPKKPLQRFTARHSAEKAATAAARAVGSAEIYELHRIAKASRGAVVIREA